ncbi:MAG: hypothetical protein VB131_07395 [Burkholderia gladioli]
MDLRLDACQWRKRTDAALGAVGRQPRVAPVNGSGDEGWESGGGDLLATHYGTEYPGLLQQEADAGEPTAMFMMGQALTLNSYPERMFKLDPTMKSEEVHAKGMNLVRRAAAAGDQVALQFAMKHGGL